MLTSNSLVSSHFMVSIVYFPLKLQLQDSIFRNTSVMVKGVGRSKGDMRLLISYGNYLFKHGLLRSKRAQVLVQHLQSLKPLRFSTGTQKVPVWLSMGDVERGHVVTYFLQQLSVQALSVECKKGTIAFLTLQSNSTVTYPPRACRFFNPRQVSTISRNQEYL